MTADRSRNHATTPAHARCSGLDRQGTSLSCTQERCRQSGKRDQVPDGPYSPKTTLSGDRAFEPAHWLNRWRDAGGGWAGTALLLPPRYRPRLRAMLDKLGAEEIRAVAEHLGVSAEVEA